MKHITTKEFKQKVFDFTKGEKYSGKNPVIVDFFAEWCQPCKMVMPVLSQFSREFDNVTFYKVDVDMEGELASEFSVSSVPTILFISSDGSIETVVGAVPPYELKKKVSALR